MTGEQVAFTLGVGLLLLLAVGVGVSIPILVELKGTLKSFRRQLEATGPKLDSVASELNETLVNVRQFSCGLKGGEQGVAELLEATGEAAQALRKLTQGVQFATSIGSVVGPAVTAFVSALRAEPEPSIQEKPSIQGEAEPGQQSTEGEGEE